MLVFYLSVESTLWSNFLWRVLYGERRKQPSMEEKHLVSNRTIKFTWLENKSKCIIKKGKKLSLILDFELFKKTATG
jgi:hypothetical protein